jgi:hypothetical protein
VASRLISILLALAVALGSTPGPIAHAADGSAVDLVGVALAPLAGSTVHVIRQQDGKSYETVIDDTGWSGSVLRFRPANIK